jgi:hypothetical protein
MSILQFTSRGTSLSAVTLVAGAVDSDLTFVLPDLAADLVAQDSMITTTITESSNLFSTTARLRSAWSATGAGTYNATTGVVDITNTGVVSSVNGATGAVTVSFGVTAQPVYEHARLVTTDYVIGLDRNAVSAGPVTLQSGVGVTAQSGSVWVIT